MNINLQSGMYPLTGSFLNRGFGLKSARQKLERQAECGAKVEFFEKQKQNLKNMQCGSIEEIERKLSMFHSYEDQIAAAKMAYNNEQLWHVMDEAEELAEKIAEQAKKAEPKTPEERKEELIEEALGIDEGEGVLTEAMEEISDTAEEVMEEISDMAEGVVEEKSLETVEGSRDVQENIENVMEEELEKEAKTMAGIDIRV